MNMVSPRILLIEDDDAEFARTRDLVQQVWGGAAELHHLRSLNGAASEIENGLFDICLLDDRLGATTGLEVLRELSARQCPTPIVLLTGTGGYDVDLAAMQAGAADYLVKADLTPTLLERAVRYAIARAKDEMALRESETRARQLADYARSLIESSLDMIVAVDPQRVITEFNRAAEACFGYSRAEVLGASVDMLYADPSAGRHIFQSIRTLGQFEGEAVNRRKNGELFTSMLSASPLLNAAGETIGVMGISRDISEQKATQDRLDQAAAALLRSHDDLLTTLNHLQIGVVMTDAGCVTFANRQCLETLECSAAELIGRQWDLAFPLDAEDAARVQAMVARPAEARMRVPVQLKSRSGRSYAMEIEVHDDPRGPRRRIVFVYDVTAVHDLRRLLSEKTRFHDLVGKSPGMLRVYDLIRDLARLEVTVLIEGETGTGKELVARAIHFASERKDKPYVAVNCAGLTDSLLGSQLFGHKRGAFTGATADQKGIFETAAGGTVFLDEIGDISPAVQMSLLRVLQEREITRVGDVQPRKVDVRILAATHRNLAAEVEAGRFRQDLLYRIRVARVPLPPLRERREDLPLLLDEFLARGRATTGKEVRALSAEAMQRLLAHDWPGNVRELQSAVEIAVIQSRGAVIQASDLPPEVGLRGADPPPTSFAQSHVGDERGRILEALRATRGNRVLAARMLGVSRATLYRRLGELQITSAEQHDGQ